ncbi:metal-dependent hydrolase [Isosphaeraceae bacterium EP7]
MGNYRQHVTFGCGTGIVYGLGAYFFGQIHWIYGIVATLLSTLGGMLPDLDSDSGSAMRGFTGLMGVIVAIGVWHRLAIMEPVPAFEYHLLAVIIAYVCVRHFLQRIVAGLTKHRGMSHSFPTCALWGTISLHFYPTDKPIIKVMMAIALMAGFFSHLLLDEICSVDLRGARVNKAFGTAMKFWSKSIMSTLVVYAMLSYSTYTLIEQWPEEPLNFGTRVDAPLWRFHKQDDGGHAAEKTLAATPPGPAPGPAPAKARTPPRLAQSTPTPSRTTPAPAPKRPGRTPQTPAARPERVLDPAATPARIGAAGGLKSRILDPIRPSDGRP